MSFTSSLGQAPSIRSLDGADSPAVSKSAALVAKVATSSIAFKERFLRHRMVQLFVLVAFVHLVLQAALQGASVANSQRAAVALGRLVDAPQAGQVLLSPTAQSTSSAPASVVSPIASASPTTDDYLRSRLLRRDNASSFNTTRFLVPGSPDGQGNVMAISEACADALASPMLLIQRMGTSSMAFVFFETWVFVASVMGIVHESVPHMTAVGISHVLASIFALFQVTQTLYFHNTFQALLQSPCDGPSPIPAFWTTATRLQVTIVVCEVVAMAVMAYLTWKLSGVLRWGTFKKLGADRRVSRQHAMSLSFEILLQLSAFWTITAQGIWLNELCTMSWSAQYDDTVELAKGYKAFLGILTVLVAPWLVLGFVAVRKQSRRMMVGFLAGDLVFLTHSIFLITQKIFSETLRNFRFLMFVTLIASLVGAATLVFGVLCLSTLRPGGSKGWTTSYPTVGENARFSIDGERGDTDKWDGEKGDAEKWDGDSEFVDLALAPTSPILVALPPAYVTSSPVLAETPNAFPLKPSKSYKVGDDGALSTLEVPAPVRIQLRVARAALRRMSSHVQSMYENARASTIQGGVGEPERMEQGSVESEGMEQGTERDKVETRS